MRIALIMASHNRVEQTTRFMRTLFEDAPEQHEIRVFLVDDGSTDGTFDSVAALGLPITLMRGDGSLYWSGGMRLASAEATKWGADLYIWANDDLRLYGHVLGEIARLAAAGRFSDEIGVGNVVRPGSVEVVYGGRVQSTKNPISFALRDDNEYGSLVDTFNGNFVVFSAGVYSQLGGFPARFRHAYSDLIMGIRAKRHSIGVRTLDFAVGEDARNPRTGTMFDAEVPLARRWKFAMSVFGLPPRDHFAFCREVVGLPRGALVFVRSYARVIRPKL